MKFPQFDLVIGLLTEIRDLLVRVERAVCSGTPDGRTGGSDEEP